MELNSDILRRDARAPLCVEPLARWRGEREFRTILAEVLPQDSVLHDTVVDVVTDHHTHAQDFIGTVDAVIVAEAMPLPQVRAAFVKLLDVCRRLASLTGGDDAIEAAREALAERYQTGGGVLPEFRWEKGAALLLCEALERAGVPQGACGHDVVAHLDQVYDDCARTVQLGFWVIAAPWRADLVDAWLFESAYAFFHHTLPHHLAGPRGLVTLLPEVIGVLAQPCTAHPP